MEPRTMRRLVATARVGRLATVGGDGRPHAVPICYALREETVYSAVDHKPKRRTALRRVANLAETGRACLLLDEYAEDWSTLWWVRLDGSGRVVADPAESARAVSALVEKYPQYRERPPAGPVIAVDITRWTGWSAREAVGGGEPAA
jgi:PPOX class probable F420-dependent enzyme